MLTKRRVLTACGTVTVTLLVYTLVSSGQFNDVRMATGYKESFRPPKNETWEKWIVVTSVSQPTEHIKALSKIKGWRIVVAGDTKTPANWSYPNCDYLSVQRQKNLDFSLTNSIPYRSYARKNIGYLYAILHGAKFIYETDDDNRPLFNLEDFVLEPKMSGLMFAGSRVFNPYPHFGQPSLWPRGFPLSEITANPQESYQLGNSWTTPTIQQGLVNGDPDMDAIFRLTTRTKRPLNVTFDPAAPPAIVPPGVYSPFNSQNTLFHYRAFWALLIPTTTTFRMCDIWRGYWAQRLQWEIGDSLGFLTANAFQLRNSHSYLEDAKEEEDMYFQTETLLDFLTEWSCPQEMSFFECVLKLTSDMADKEFWKHGDVELARLWLDDLKSFGYVEPRRIRANFDPRRLSVSGINNVTINDESHQLIKVSFAAARQSPPDVTSAFKQEEITYGAIHRIFSLCPDLNETKWMNGSNSMASYFSDILLVVVFNFPGFYANVKYIETYYGALFPNIVYCGENIARFHQEVQSVGHKNLSFIDAPVNKGYDGYICAIKAMEIGYNVKGYLVSGDDVLFKPWKLLNASKDQIWVTAGTNEVKINVTERQRTWGWWNKPIGNESYIKTINDLKTMGTPQGITTKKMFFQNLVQYSGADDIIYSGLSDLYYIPSRLKRDFTWYLSSFYQHHVFLEITVPTVVHGLANRKDIVYLKGSNLWWGNRPNAFKFYPQAPAFVHPVKLTDLKLREGLCSNFMADLLEQFFV